MVDARRLGYIGEGSVSVVVVQNISPGATDEQVLVAIVVVVAYRDTEIEVQVLAQQTRLGRDILKSAVVPLFQEAVVVGRVGLLHFRQLRAVGEEDVHLAVVVVIERWPHRRTWAAENTCGLPDCCY